MRTFHRVSVHNLRRAQVVVLASALYAAAPAAAVCEHLYAGAPNHRELASRALDLALLRGFSETAIAVEEVRSRLEVGAFLEDFESIPGVVGRFYPTRGIHSPHLTTAATLRWRRFPSGVLSIP